MSYVFFRAVTKFCKWRQIIPDETASKKLLSTVFSSIPIVWLSPGVKCVDHLTMMSLVAAQFEADFRQFFNYDIALETCTAISNNSCKLSNIGMNKFCSHYL